MNKFKTILSMFLAFLLGMSFCACKKENNDMNNDNPIEFEEKELESNYTYMWHKDGLNNEENRMMFQTENYKLLVDGRNGNILAMDPETSDKFVECDIDTLSQVETTYELKVGQNYVGLADISSAPRIIESGRYVNRLDNISLRYKGQGTKYIGRAEFVAIKNRFALNYEIYAQEAGQYSFRYTLKFTGKSLTSCLDGRGVKVIDNDGNGFIFLKQNVQGVNVIFDIKEDSLTASVENLQVKASTFTGFGLHVIPVKNNNIKLVNELLAEEETSIVAKTSLGSDLNVKFDKTEGLYYVDMNPVTVGGQDMSSNRTTYEISNFEILNDSNVDIEPTISFTKTESFSITGYSPIIRDAVSLEPTGEPVQISKDWHVFSSVEGNRDYQPSNSAKRLYEGTWAHSWVAIKANKDQTTKRQYVCAYGQWGSLYASSHSQLCLIGWGGDQVWDQSALGSWGESVTYDPDVCLGRSMIDDVRPFLVKAPTGQDAEYSWSGNVGGADFLNCITTDEQRLINQKITYIDQAPCMTNVNYRGNTQDGSVTADITINMGRTDDIVRNYYTVKYYINKDTEFKRLSLFKVAADGYADNSFTKYAYGTENEVIEYDKPSASARSGYDNGEARDAKEDNFWFGLYDATSTDEKGDVMMIVRSYNATINGKTYTKPGYNLFGTSNGGNQMSCEITIPTQCGKVIKAGSVIEFVVEYSITPADQTRYYGSADYLVQTKSLMGTYEGIYQQVVGGIVNVNCTKGTLKSNYPITIDCSEDSGTICEFEVNGGLGYIPVVFNNLTTYKGYKLQVKSGNEWVNVDQSVKGNDYWQTHYDEKTNKYQLVYNIKNTNGLSFNTTNTYRLIKGN